MQFWIVAPSRNELERILNISLAKLPFFRCFIFCLIVWNVPLLNKLVNNKWVMSHYVSGEKKCFCIFAFFLVCSKYFTRFFYKNKVHKNIRLQWQNIKNMLRTYQGFGLKKKERYAPRKRIFVFLKKKEYVKNIFRLKTERNYKILKVSFSFNGLMKNLYSSFLLSFLFSFLFVISFSFVTATTIYN